MGPTLPWLAGSREKYTCMVLRLRDESALRGTALRMRDVSQAELAQVSIAAVYSGKVQTQCCLRAAKTPAIINIPHPDAHLSATHRRAKNSWCRARERPGEHVPQRCALASVCHLEG
ncbi:Uncharacterized protein DAT39_017037 [Clarias magur]|uniref:Uncharacterized protein n=1 Tax=Clarias magur TaxID=1594786 RepID=A0A8J4TM25_CLAMG|nr:Uncharacterized protein DAT39_017037 [Clarias magur]